MTIWTGLILGAYLLGSVPASYLAAKLARGIDLRQYGTGQVGGGNLWRMTSWRFALPVGIFDLSKGLVMVWVAQLAGLGIAQQLIVGLAAVIGHNWSVFLRFSGGRGIGTAMGVILILPLINEMTPWAAIACFGVLAVGSVMLRSSPLPVLAGVTTLPIVSSFYEPLSVTLGFLAVFLVIVIKRLTAPRAVEAVSLSKGRLLLNRLLFDRDIMDRKVWMYRMPAKASTKKQPRRREG
ncbi:MAG: glycerol-3-phosphate acyltransferase [Dehalococcoidales bacterium]